MCGFECGVNLFLEMYVRTLFSEKSDDIQRQSSAHGEAETITQSAGVGKTMNQLMQLTNQCIGVPCSNVRLINTTNSWSHNMSFVRNFHNMTVSYFFEYQRTQAFLICVDMRICWSMFQKVL